MYRVLLIYLLCCASVAQAGDFTMPGERGRGHPGWPIVMSGNRLGILTIPQTQLDFAGTSQGAFTNVFGASASASGHFRYTELRNVITAPAVGLSLETLWTPTGAPGGSGIFNTRNSFGIGAANTQTIGNAMRAFGCTAQNSGTGNITGSLTANTSSVVNAGNATLATGVVESLSLANNAGGTLTTGWAIQITQPSSGNSSTWGTWGGINIAEQVPSGSATLTNPPVALLIDSQTGTGAYAIKEGGAGINVLGSGNTAVGTTSDPTATFSVAEKMLVTSAGLVSKYNNIATVSGGHPAEYGTADLTGQTAAKTATTLYTPAATGMFRISCYLQVTTAATTSSILGGATGVVITYTDGDGSVAQSNTMALSTTAGVIATTAAGNTTVTNLNGSEIIYAKTGVAIQYAIGYTSVGVTPMAYAAHLKVEAL